MKRILFFVMALVLLNNLSAKEVIPSYIIQNKIFTVAMLIAVEFFGFSIFVENYKIRTSLISIFVAVAIANVITSIIVLELIFSPVKWIWGIGIFVLACLVEWLIYIALFFKSPIKKQKLLMVSILINIISFSCIGVGCMIRKPRLSFYEYYAVSRLKYIAVCQKYFREKAFVDQDRDGKGEYGLLNEMVGVVRPRNSVGLPPSAPLERILSSTFVVTKENYGLTDYHTQVHLPGCVTDREKKFQMGSKNSEVINAQEKYWIAYAWPKEYWHGSYCFVIDHNGKVFFLENRKSGKAVYEGKKKPAYNAAMNRRETIGKIQWGKMVVNEKEKTVDGEIWKPMPMKVDSIFPLLLIVVIIESFILIFLKLIHRKRDEVREL